MVSSTFDHCKHSQICSPKMVHMCLPDEILVNVDAKILDTTVSPVISMASHTHFVPSLSIATQNVKSDIKSCFIK